jgi:hypothetical protein
MILSLQIRRVGMATVCSIAVLAGSAISRAENPAQWTISDATTGNDVFWTSPTAVDLGYPRYATTFEYTRVNVFYALGSVDITDSLDSSGTGVSDMLPVTLVDDVFTESITGTSATVNVVIDASGFGQISITDVDLGTIIIFPITRIEVDANLAVTGLVPGDFDGNLIVDSFDLALWESAYGVSNAADTNFDGESDGADFLDWQRFVGSDYTALIKAAAAVPEPSAWLLALAGLLVVSRPRDVRVMARELHFFRPEG